MGSILPYHLISKQTNLAAAGWVLVYPNQDELLNAKITNQAEYHNRGYTQPVTWVLWISSFLFTGSMGVGLSSTENLRSAGLLVLRHHSLRWALSYPPIPPSLYSQIREGKLDKQASEQYSLACLASLSTILKSPHPLEKIWQLQSRNTAELSQEG